MEKCPELGPLLQHGMGTAAEPELGLKGERCRRVPGDAAGLVIASTTKGLTSSTAMQPQDWFGRPAMFSLSPCPAALSPYTPRSSDQSMPVPCPPPHPHPFCTTPGCSGSRQGAKALSCPCPAMGDAAGHGALGTSTARAESEVATGISFWRFPVAGLLFLFVRLF